jgi:ABC-type multidrug transport system permease subunit
MTEYEIARLRYIARQTKYLEGIWWAFWAFLGFGVAFQLIGVLL